MEARTKLLEVQQRSKEQRWLLEDQQQQLETKMSLQEAERRATMTEESSTRHALEIKLHLGDKACPALPAPSASALCPSRG